VNHVLTSLSRRGFSAACSVSTTDTNIADIEQSSDGNTVAIVHQRYSGTNESANNLNILQATGDDNKVGYAWQLGTGNSTDIEQTGTGNSVDTFQYGTKASHFSNGSNNDISVVMSGDDNGNGSLTGGYSGAETAYSAGAVGGPWSVGLRSGTVTQRGDNNEASLDLAGNKNQFGVHQLGEGNDSLGIMITGDENSFSSDQVGNFNQISLATVTGWYNSIGFVQEGDYNLGSADISGDNNRSLISQTGNNNDTELFVNGDLNTADLVVTGDRNLLRAQQGYPGGTGDGNTMTVTVFGDDNNNTAATGNFTGDALSARNDANDVTGQPFGKGRLWQHGSNNDMTILVGSVGSPSNENIFAALQQGDGNMINGSISDGSSNQAAVAQLGSNNSTTFTQSGSFNSLGVTQ
jgi:hypothetical protein